MYIKTYNLVDFLKNYYKTQKLYKKPITFCEKINQ